MRRSIHLLCMAAVILVTLCVTSKTAYANDNLSGGVQPKYKL